MNTDIRAIYLDLGGTFRIIEENKAYADAAKKKIAQLCGITDPRSRGVFRHRHRQAL
jgi:hypothetical protein